MQFENIKEYELVRSEMITVKECITKYLGFALGGTGAAIYGRALIRSLHVDSFALNIIYPALSLIISFVLLILFYKFHSHNRFAGYCKLLSHEKYSTRRPLKTSLISWEIAVEGERSSGIDKEDFFDPIVKAAKIKKINKKDLKKLLKLYSGKKPYIEKARYRGIWILLSAIFGNIETRSWAFPPLIVSLFFSFVSVFYPLVGTK